MLVRADHVGLVCAGGRFAIDPRQRVDRAVVTHAHFDHVRRGCGEYYCARSGASILRQRLPSTATIHERDYDEIFHIGDVAVSFHPAGHMLGSAQVRLERRGEVAVVSGDYKRQADPSCEAFEPVSCGVFVTEATFAHPRFSWSDPEEVIASLCKWWEENRRGGKVSILFTYVVGKSQRILAELGYRICEPVWVHPDVELYNSLYRQEGVSLAETKVLPRRIDRRRLDGALVIAPPRYRVPTWYDRFGDVATALVSGWPADGETQAAVDRCFQLSDHVDWPGLLQTIEETGAKRIRTVHGDATALLELLQQRGVDAEPLERPAT